VNEDNPPADVEPLEWFLLTTVEIKSADDALSCVQWYCLRWRIEDWHRVLKSGCRVENMAHKTAERLRRAIAINLVIAWRIMLMTLLGREIPELAPEVVFSDLEIEVLKAYAKKKPYSPGLFRRRSNIGSENWRLPRPCKRSAPGSSDNVARLFSITTYVRGVHASEYRMNITEDSFMGKGQC